MIQFKLNEIMHESTIFEPYEVILWYKKMCKISILLPKFVAFFCYMVNIHLEKWLIRCDTKRAIWWDLYNRQISIFASNIWVPSFARCRLTNANDSWKNKGFLLLQDKCYWIWYKNNKFHTFFLSLYDFLWLYYHDYSWFMYDLI